MFGFYDWLMQGIKSWSAAADQAPNPLCHSWRPCMSHRGFHGFLWSHTSHKPLWVFTQFALKTHRETLIFLLQFQNILGIRAFSKAAKIQGSGPWLPKWEQWPVTARKHHHTTSSHFLGWHLNHQCVWNRPQRRKSNVCWKVLFSSQAMTAGKACRL